MLYVKTHTNIICVGAMRMENLCGEFAEVRSTIFK